MMAKPIMFMATLSCDEHDDAVVVYRASLAECPMCALQKQIETAQALIGEIQIDLAAQAEDLKKAGI